MPSCSATAMTMYVMRRAWNGPSAASSAGVRIQYPASSEITAMSTPRARSAVCRPSGLDTDFMALPAGWSRLPSLLRRHPRSRRGYRVRARVHRPVALDEFGRRQRMADVVALRAVAAQLAQVLQRLAVLHALGHHLHVEV